jgi:ABC-2 type transport system permease protein
MSLSRIYAIFVRQIFLQMHNPVRFVSTFLWIAIDVVLWGFLTKYLDQLGLATFSFSTLLFGAIILWQFLLRVQQGVMNAFFEDVWSQNFMNFFASPLKIKEYISGLVLTGIATSIVSFSVVVMFAGVLFGYDIFTIGLALLPFLLILFLFGVALGIFAAAIILRFGPSAEWLAWPIPFFIQPFVGVFFPIAILPHSLQILAKCVPVSYVFESMRSIILTGAFSSELYSQLFIGFALVIIYLIISYLFFLFVYRYVLKTGSLSRFSAETA